MDKNNLPPWQRNVSNNQYLPQTCDNPSGAPLDSIIKKQPESSEKGTTEKKRKTTL